MKNNTELVFRAICSFYDGEYADFTLYSIRNAVREDALQDNIKILKTVGAIEDYTKNGYARRFKIKNPVDCPDFLFDERFDFATRAYLLEKWNAYNKSGIYATNSKFETKLNVLGLTTFDLISNPTFIKNHITVPDTMIVEKDDFGYKIKNKPIPEEMRKNIYKCRYCGDEDPEHFGSQHTICKKCYNKLDRNRRSMSERLLKASKQNAKQQGYDHDLTQEYIQQLLDEQHGKCKYTGVLLENDRKDKLTYPTIDRIDSSKGYIQGNVCICTWYANTMKSNLSIEQFKEFITKIYNNLDNF